jgi:nitroimidazol reductase NimA-like FMN-containing flavoprotein (pyridoxamine 5'-phosphate oxidase superfamily)
MTQERPDPEYIVSTVELEEALCWRLLARAWVGRVAFIEGGLPSALPVNCSVLARNVVFRTGEETTLYDLGDGSPVAFEVDQTDRVAEAGWSVLVKGTLWEVTDADERSGLAELPVHPWAAGTKDRWMKIVPSAVSGRMISRHRAMLDGIRVPYMPPD